MTVRRDFSKKTYEKRIAVIEGEEVDVSRIPTRVMLELIELRGKREELEGGSIDAFRQIIDIMAKICKSNPTVTTEWLVDNTDIMQLLDFIEFVIEPLRTRTMGPEKKVSKNSETPSESQEK